jgi:hypothetical protein
MSICMHASLKTYLEANYNTGIGLDYHDIITTYTSTEPLPSLYRASTEPFAKTLYLYTLPSRSIRQVIEVRDSI